MQLSDRASIVGVGWTDYTRMSGRTAEHLAVEACRNAAADAGVKLADIDGVVTFGISDTATALVVATALGLPRVSYYADYSAGGSAACGVVLHAAMAVATGQARNVLVYRSLNGASGQRYGGAKFSELLAGSGIHSDSEPQFLDTAGITMPAQHFALLCRRHMIRYGTTERHLGAVALTCREHALLNERAMMRKPISIEDYEASPWLAEPFRVLDCCLQSDGACAVLVSSTEAARDMRRPPVLVKSGVFGAGPAARGGMWGNFWPDHTESYMRYFADDLFRGAGVERGDIDFAQIYDCFTYSVLVQFEDLGFCGKGEAGDFFLEGRAKLGADLPVNTSGGLLSEAYIHGLNLVVEAALQLRGDVGARQVPGAQLGVVTAGGAATTGSGLILGRMQ